MTIEWFGKTCFRLTTSGATVVIDPFSPKTVGLHLPRLQADLVLLTNDDQDASVVGGTPRIVDEPGEYEVKQTFVYGLATNGGAERSTLFLIEAEGISVAHLGNLGHQLSNGELERLEGVDILCIPVGGHGVLNADRAAAVISAVEPRIVIPMQFKIPGLKQPLDGIGGFAKELGVKESETLEKLKLSAKDLPQDNMRVVILTP